MARIFISYSRADRQFIDQFIPLVRRVYSSHNVWYDDDIYGGVDWWQMILEEIKKCDLFVYLISNESLESEYCRAELREALRLRKYILPVIVRRLKPAYPGVVEPDLAQVLRKTHYIDMTAGFQDATVNATLYEAINRLLELVPKKPSVSPTSAPTPEPQVADKRHKTTQFRNLYLGAGFLLVLVAFAVVLALQLAGSIGKRADSTDVSPTTSVALEMTDTATSEPTLSETQATVDAEQTPTIQPTNAVVASFTPRPTNTTANTPSITPTPTRMVDTTATEQVNQTATASANINATQTAQSGTVTVTTSSANLRSGPGTNYTAVDTAVRGEVFTVIARSGTGDSLWYVIRDVDQEVWIHHSVVSFVGDLSVIQVAETIPAPPVVSNPSPTTSGSSGTTSNTNGQTISFPYTYSGTLGWPNHPSYQQQHWYYFSVSTTQTVNVNLSTFDQQGAQCVVAVQLYAIDTSWYGQLYDNGTTSLMVTFNAGQEYRIWLQVTGAQGEFAPLETCVTDYSLRFG